MFLYAPKIAFIGGMGAGKTTAAEYLFNRGDLPYTLMRFSGPLKRIAREIFGEGADQDRELLQWLGTDVVRQRDPEAWCRLAMKEMDRHNMGGGAAILVDDCRFPNEYWALKERDFTFVRIDAEQAIRVDRLRRMGKLTDLAQLDHESEQHWPTFEVDHTITNHTDDFDAFYTKVDAVVRREVART